MDEGRRVFSGYSFSFSIGFLGYITWTFFFVPYIVILGYGSLVAVVVFMFYGIII